MGSLRQRSVTIRLTGNNGYRLLVRRSKVNPAEAADRIWVRGADGIFHELTPGSTVTIAEERLAGNHQQEVWYRLEDLTNSPPAVEALPVHYDIAVQPVI
jgi:hypothetical protein